MNHTNTKNGLLTATGILLSAAPLIHFGTDVAELLNGGFTFIQLTVNYAAFILIPFAVMGLALCHGSRAGKTMYAGAFLYSIAFIYFSFTSMYAIVDNIPDYHSLWTKLGFIYTLHGGFMVFGGILLGASVFRQAILPRWTSALFISGLLLNALLSFLPLPEVVQIAGSTIRNAGLTSMGIILFIRGLR